ncbi:uncharacterized protein LOC128677917 [Plodia interpunctella]|uniref:uncharacterized protein LOC128677917 n=1 Tax=Plodia interpunctella TaxID=58824 RepID=UPI002368CF7E|nr:uncharacterized protein LOC128677917 [Plodia interpunctella]
MDQEKPFRNIIEKIAREYNYNDYSIKVTPISSGGSNYTSVLYTGTISAPDKEDLQLFAKTAAFGAKLREEAPVTLFDTERFAYEELAKLFSKIEDKHKIPEEDRLILSKYYGSNSNVFEETIVLENLCEKGYTLHDRLKSVDWPYASKAVEVLAKFHALSMCLAEKYPDTFKRYCEHLKSSLESLAINFSKGFELFLPYSIEEVNDKNKEKLKAFFNKEDNTIESQFKPVRRTVFAHGDYRPSNLMHRNNEDGSVDVIPVDLQTVMPSSGVIDLLYFIFTGTDGAFRQQYYSRLVDHYYASISRMLRAYGLNPDKVYPREDFDFELQERLPYGLIAAAFVLPIVTVEVADAPTLGNDELDLASLKIKTGKAFPERINDVVEDFVAWGRL